MFNLIALEQLARARELEIRAATERASRLAVCRPRRRARERLGWSLVRLGARLALPGGNRLGPGGGLGAAERGAEVLPLAR